MARIDKLLEHQVDSGASDLHISAGSPPLYRMDGELTSSGFRALSAQESESLILEILDEKQQNQLRENLNLDFAHQLGDKARFRGNVFYITRGMCAVFRTIPTRIKTVEELGLPEVVAKLARQKKGLVVVTGPTGSGKSTTLAAMIDMRNSEFNEHILTLEDPVEFIHQNKQCLINQRQVGEQVGTFADGLRAALREDPDVILVGEMRDLETIQLAITAAETGHLVFGTLHTNSAPKTVDRIIDAFPKDQQQQIRTMLSESLKGVLAQVLLKRAEGKGRAAAIEVLMANSALANLIREGKTHQVPSLMQTGKNQGMRTMDDSLMELLRNKAITAEEAVRYAVNKELFLRHVGSGKEVNYGAGEQNKVGSRPGK